MLQLLIIKINRAPLVRHSSYSKLYKNLLRHNGDNNKHTFLHATKHFLNSEKYKKINVNSSKTDLNQLDTLN